MASRGWSSVLVVFLVMTQAVSWPGRVWAASAEEIEQKLKALQEQVNDLKKQLEQSNKTQAPVTQAPPPLPAAVQPVAQVTTVPAAPPLVSRPSWLSDFKLGGYGSTRFEANDLNKFSDTFTFPPLRAHRGRDHRRAPAQRRRDRVRALDRAGGRATPARRRGPARLLAVDRGQRQVRGLARAGLDAVRPGRLGALPGRHDAGAARPLQHQPR